MNNDSTFQKVQSLLLSGLYAVLQTCNGSSGEQKCALTHAAVLFLSSNRESVLKRRDLICPDLNKQYGSLHNLSIPMSFFLLSKKVSSGISIMRKVKPFIPISSLLNIYQSIVEPYFDYCSIVWNGIGDNLADKLQKLQTAKSSSTGDYQCRIFDSNKRNIK